MWHQNYETPPSHFKKKMFKASLIKFFPQEEEYRDLVSISQSMEEQYGQYFDSVIPFEEVFVFSRYWNFLLNLFKP